ncbi:secreted protein/lipoprotein [Streptomyces sp. NBC_01166]|uniref:secreted protein/lipoprotein n=1 Tax=Streptomyces sp. NBC_01166 TaxID=2903755 RepID=UPI00386D7EEF|nr:secreted protein/lipoprotein [Streptomyces sp. NBC_01166]
MVTARQKCSRSGVALRCGAATLVLVLTGCGDGHGHGESDAKPPTDPTTRATSAAAVPRAAHSLPPSGTADGATEAEVLEVYGLMWAEQIKAYRAASAGGTDLKRYTAPDVWTAFEADLARMDKERTVMRGDLRHEPEAIVPADAQPPAATVKDCVDASNWQTLDTTTGWRIPPPPGQPARYAVTAKLERVNGERWTVTEYTPHRTRPCQGLSDN